MATDKKSVLLYCDIIYTVEELDDADAGLLFKHYLRYINDQNPEPPNKLIKIVFEPIKQNLKRDLKKWESKSLKNSENAKMRWDANASERTKSDANDADKVIVTVKATVTDKVKEKDILIFPFNSESFRKEWDILANEKKWRKKSITALQASLDKLGGVTEAEAIEAIKQAIIGEYQGIFPKPSQTKQPLNITTKLSDQDYDSKFR